MLSATRLGLMARFKLLASCIAGFGVGLLLTDAFHVVGAKAAGRFADASPQELATPQAQTTLNARVFGSHAGLVLNFIKPDKTADFEAVVAKSKDALQRSDKPDRKQQAAVSRPTTRCRRFSLRRFPKRFTRSTSSTRSATPVDFSRRYVAIIWQSWR